MNEWMLIKLMKIIMIMIMIIDDDDECDDEVSKLTRFLFLFIYFLKEFFERIILLITSN
jgi:hypothetical protein